MNNLNKYNNFVASVDDQKWRTFIKECLNKQCYGFDDFYKEFDFSKFKGKNSGAEYEKVRKILSDLKEDGVHLVFRTAYEVPDIYASKLTTNNMHVFLFIPTNTSFVFKKLPYNWVTPKTGDEFAKSFMHYFPRMQNIIMKEHFKMSEFDFNGKFVEFMYANVKDAGSYQRYLNDELERNKKYIDPSNKKAWGAKEVRTINGLGTQK